MTTLAPETTGTPADPQEWKEYETWLKKKQAKLKSGAQLVIGGIALRLLLVFLVPVLPDFLQLFGILLYNFITLAALWGVIMICDAKGRSRWYWTIGFFVFALSDRNLRTPPNKPSTGFKPKDAVFTDW